MTAYSFPTLLDDVDDARAEHINDAYRAIEALSNGIYPVQRYASVGGPITTSAVDAALAAMPTTGGVLQFPAGSHTCNITITKHGVVIQGAGPRATTITGNITWATTDASEGYASYPTYTWFEHLQIIGTVGVVNAPLPYFCGGRNVIFNNESLGSTVLSLNFRSTTRGDVMQHTFWQFCQFRNGGVYLQTNTGTIDRCRIGWANQDAALTIDGTCHVINSTIENNQRSGILLKDYSVGCRIEGNYFESNNTDNTTNSYGDIDVAAFVSTGTSVSGGHTITNNLFTPGGKSAYCVRFPGTTNQSVPCEVSNNIFGGSVRPGSTSPYVQLQGYERVHAFGNRGQDTRAHIYDNPNNLLSSFGDNGSDGFDDYSTTRLRHRLIDSSGNALVTLGSGSGYGEIAFRSTAKIKGDSASRKMKTDDHFQILGGITLPTKDVGTLGAVGDSDVVGGAAQGNVIIDNVANKIYVRCASGWKSVTVS